MDPTKDWQNEGPGHPEGYPGPYLFSLRYALPASSLAEV
jgi:hypothetical protein